MKPGKGQLIDGELSASAALKRYTSLPLTAGGYPFALSEDEKLLTKDQWAWRFLRLNPFYRHDYELQLLKPTTIPKGAPGSYVADRIDDPPPQDFLDLDSRYFCMRGEILSSKFTWPEYKKQTLAEYWLSDAEFRFKEVEVRDFDSSRDFGVSHWFDPSLEDLPPLEPGQSWFYSLIEPIWDTASRHIFGPASVSATLPNGRKIIVGYEGDVRRIKFQKVWKQKSKSLPDGSLLSWLEDIKEDADKASPPNPCFTTQTEVVFLIDLDLYLEPQLDHVRRIAESFQKLLQQEGLSKKLPCAPVGFEPLMFHPARAVGRGFSSILRAFEDFSTRSAQAKKNFRAILFDVAYSVPSQITYAEKLLTLEQEKLQQSDLLAHLLRKKDGNKTGDHWLKRALCLLELHLNRNGLSEDVSLGAKRLVSVIYNPGDLLHAAVMATSPLNSAALPSDDIDARLDAIKDALRVGKDLSEYGYKYLIVMPEK